MKKLLSSLILLTFLAGWNNPQSHKEKVSFDGDEMLRLVNKARASKHKCGGKSYAPAQPLKWSQSLTRAAQKHANDMARRDFFDHENPDGEDAARRIERENYRWRTVGENIAKGSRNTAEVVEGWLNSPGHCGNIMNKEFTEIGAALSKDGQYWVQVFAAPASEL